MDNFLIMQVAMEATAMPPPTSSVSSDETELSGDASFDSTLEKALNAQPDAETLALATEAVLVPLQSPVIQPMFDGDAVQVSEAEALALTQKMYALVEEQTQQAQSAMVAIVDSEQGAVDTAQAVQSTQASLTEATAKEGTTPVVVFETPVLVETSESQSAAQTMEMVSNAQGTKVTSESSSNSQIPETELSSQASSRGEQTSEKPAVDLVDNVKANSDGKAQAPIDVAKSNNDPSQPDTTGETTLPKPEGKTVNEANNSELKIDLTKATLSGKQSADSMNAQASSVAVETTQPLVDETTATVQAPVSESRKVKANLGSMEGESPPQVSTGSRAVQSQDLDAQVKEPARLAEARTPEMINQITKGIDLLSRSDGQSLRLQLHPENLGKIDIRLSTGSEGVTVTLTTDMQLTGNLMERSLSELRTSLADAGINLASLSVNSGQQQTTDQESHQWFSGKESRNTYIKQNSSNEELPSVNSGWKESAIDYRV